MKVAELKEELVKHGQSTQGLKAVLLECLKKALGKHLPVLTEADQSAHTNDDLKGFTATAWWKPLVPQEVAVPEPENIVRTLHAPTVSRQDASFLPQKHNFVEVFDHEPFVAKEKVLQFHRNGRAMLNNGQTVWTEQFTNFDPVTFAAVWHILGLNIGGSSKKAAGISPDGTTIVFGTDCNFVKAWVNNQNIRNILHFSDMSNLSDMSFDIDMRLSRSNEPTNTQPVLLGGAYALISEQDANLVALDLVDGGATEWTLQTRTAHLAMPIVVNDDEASQWVIYDLSQAGILRQFLVDYTNASAAS